MKVYIAGQITGNPNYMREFKQAEEKFKAEGHIVVNPTVLPDGLEHLEYMCICLAMIDVCDAVYFLPSWTNSKGAYMEMGYALGMNKTIIESSFLTESMSHLLYLGDRARKECKKQLEND